MSKEYILATACIFLFCISIDYIFNKSLNAQSKIDDVILSFVKYLVLSAVLGKIWFVLIKIIKWFASFWFTSLVLGVLGILCIVIIPLWVISLKKK